MDFLSIVTLISNLLPQLITILSEVEAALPPGSTIEQKLALVEQFLRSANANASDAIADFEKFWPIISDIITSLDGAKKAASVVVAP